MTFDLSKILASKRTYRQNLAARDIVEKLQMLDAMRERALALRSPHPPEAHSTLLSENISHYPRQRSR